MKIKIQSKINSSDSIVIIPVFEDNKKSLPKTFPASAKKFIKEIVASDEFEAKFGETIFTYNSAKDLAKKMLVIGMGESEKMDSLIARKIGGKIGKFLKSKKISEATILTTDETLEYSPQMLEGLLTSQYDLAKYKTKDKKNKEKKYELKAVNFVTESKAKGLKKDLEAAEIIANSSHMVKDLVNGPSNKINEAYMVTLARKIAKENKYKIIVLGDKELKKMKWGGLLAVNQGSSSQARCVVLEYNGGKSGEKPVTIVGKGMLFDAGGYNLKPTGYMETMQQDMAGAATVLGVFASLKKLGIKKNVVGIMPLAENMVSENAYKPSDIITMFSGKNVEITNTDAEGRLILADGITYATQLKPKNIITIATLTGAVGVALGSRYAGLLSNDDELSKEITEAGNRVDELVWRLPIHDDYRKRLDSKYADFKNCDITSREVGTSSAAAFLEKFVEDNKWAHLDIGGTAFTKDPQDFETESATAHGMRVLLAYLD